MVRSGGTRYTSHPVSFNYIESYSRHPRTPSDDMRGNGFAEDRGPEVIHRIIPLRDAVYVRTSPDPSSNHDLKVQKRFS